MKCGVFATAVFTWGVILSGLQEVTMAQEGTITILFTGDRHGHIEPWLGWEPPLIGKSVGGTARLATAVKSVRKEIGAKNVLLLDSGDAIGDTFIAAETKGKAVIELMNLVGYDAMTIGNHEPDFTPNELRLRMEEAQFPILAANVYDDQGRLFAKPFLLRQVGGINVGILGLAYPNTPMTTARKNVQGLVFESATDAAKKFLPGMRAEGAQVIIALTHGGLGAEKKWAESVPGIDVIVGGHSHNRMDSSLKSGETIIVQAGAHGGDLGRLDLRIQQGRITDARTQLILLDETIPSDQTVAERIRALIAPHRARQDEVIAHAIEPIVRAQTLAGDEPRKRSHESPADSLFADILRQETLADVALLPGVGYGVAIPKGPITVGLLRNLIPHESKVVTLKLTGKQIREVLEQSLLNVFTEDPDRKVGGMIQVSGLAFTYDPEASEGRRIRDLQLQDRPLEPSRRYKVVTNSMLAAGGHKYKTFLEGEEREEHGEQFALIRRWMKDHRQIRTPDPGRIRQEQKM